MFNRQILVPQTILVQIFASTDSLISLSAKIPPFGAGHTCLGHGSQCSCRRNVGAHPPAYAKTHNYHTANANGHDSETDLFEVPTIYKASVRSMQGDIPPEWPYMESYINFRILEVPLK